MSERRVRATVVGAGVGGLTAAIALELAGADVTVYERRPEAQTLAAGGGMVLWHNALRALKLVGVEMQDAGVPLELMDWRSWRDDPLAAWPMDEMAERFGVRAIGVTRDAVHPRLLAVLSAGALEQGADVRGFTTADGEVHADTADGAARAADVLIGADGLNSAVRRQLLGDQQPRYAGYVIDFGVVDLEHPALVRGYREYDGKGHRFLYFPVAPGRWYFSCIYRRDARQADASAAPKAELLERYRGWPEPVEALINAAPESEMFGRDGLDRKPVDRWGEGPVTLLGDAAHPMTPNLGQGACQAIEDGVVLGRCLERHPGDPVAALREYEERRIERTKHFVERSWAIGSFGRWKNPLAVWLRFRIQRRVVPRAALEEHFEAMGYEF